MQDKIVELENNNKYVILNSKKLDNKNYYYGLKIKDNGEPTNNYLFFEEFKDKNDTYLLAINDENIKGILLTAFTVNYLNKVYDKV